MIESFKLVLQSAGLEPPDRIEPGTFHRFPGIGKRNGNKAGWCQLFPDEMGGIYGDHSTGLSESWQVEREQPLTEAERAAFRQQVEESRKQAAEQRRTEQAAAAAKAKDRWDTAQPASQDHPYLVKKQIPAHGTRQDGDKLLIPMRDESGKLWALQTIDPDGGKLFHPYGCRTKGLYSSIGGKPEPDAPICTAEGFATAAAIHEATGYPVAIAFSDHNMEAVSITIKNKLPGHPLILCADDDRKEGSDNNPGIEAATRAALAVGGMLVVPDMGRKADFWDLWHEQGADAVKMALSTARSCEPVEHPLEQAPAMPEVYGTKKAVSVELLDFLSFDFPPRDNLLSPWLPSQGLTMVYAARGVGKTHFALGLAYAVASGGTFLGWEAPYPAGVLYIDGEMPGAVMQERLSAIVASNDFEPSAPFTLLTPDLQPEGMPRIDTEEGQQIIEAILTDDIKLIVIDNISTLSQTRENEADGWTPVQAWALKQRAAGRSVLFVHHAGKGGQQRGTSRREDVLDTVISLKRPIDYQADQGAVFEIHFEKARGIFGDDVKPIEATLTTDEQGRVYWLTRTVESGTFERVVQMLNDGLKQHEIAVELGINKSTASRHARKAKADGLINIKVNERVMA